MQPRHPRPITRGTVLFLALVVSALVVGACGDRETTASGDVRPFSEVQETEFVFEADETNPSRGIFRVTTTEPMICAIIWGETEEFGNMNNTLGMDGTGVIEHNVFLPGAEPGVEYSYVVQGSTADGTLYRSEIGTFTIQAAGGDGGAGDAAQSGSNLALGATVVDVSSEFSDSFAARNAIDGDESTEWATSGSGDDAYITIDLGAETEIAGVEFPTRSMADGTAITNEYTVTIDEGEALGPFEAGNLANPRFAEIDTAGQIVRFDVVATTGGNTGAVEVRVFGPADGG